MGIKSKKEDRVRKMNGFIRLLLDLSESFFGLTSCLLGSQMSL